MKKLALLLAFLPSFAFAQSKEQTAMFDKADWPKDKVIECKAASKDAVLKMPKEIEGFARIICTKTGHHFLAKRGWHWHHQAEGLPAFYVSAGAGLAKNGVIGEDVGHKAYFTKIEVTRVDYGSNFGKIYPAALSQNQVVLGAFQAMTAAKKQPLQVTLTTKNGETMVIHVLDTFKPYDFAYVATIPGTGAVVLLNDLTKVANAQKPAENK